MTKLALSTIFVVLAATCSATAVPGAFARNPLKPAPGDSSSPGGGGLGGSQASNSFELANYQAVCQNRGRVSIDVRNMTVNGHRQAFLHTEAQQPSGGAENAALAYVQKGGADFLNIVMSNPITFQLVNGQTVLVTATYLNSHDQSVTALFVRPDSPFAKNFVPLTSTGSNSFMIPIGSGRNAIPKGARLINLLFQTVCDQNCVTYTADLNNLRVNGTSVGIKSDSKSCGSDCSASE